MKKLMLYLLIGFTFILFFVFMVYSFNKTFVTKQLPALSQIRNFNLKDMSGESFELRRMKDKVWIVNFFFTTCSDVCVLMTKNMKSLYESFKIENDIAFVSVTVNPEQDTVEVLKEYTKKLKIDSEKWHFLTGDRQVIKEMLVSSFKLGDMKDPIFHSSYFSLVDKHGIIRGYYDGTSKDSIAELFKDAATLLKWK